MSDLETLARRVVALEERAMHAERQAEALDEVVREQQTALDALRREVHRLQAQLRGLAEGAGGSSEGEEPPPPHY